METKANYVAVGAFVLVCAIGLVVSLLWLAGAQYAQEYDYYQAIFKGSVSGLGKGTTTRYNGSRWGASPTSPSIPTIRKASSSRCRCSRASTSARIPPPPSPARA